MSMSPRRTSSSMVVSGVMTGAQEDEVVGLVTAAVLAMFDVVDLEVSLGAAAGNGAAAMVAPPDEGARRRGDVDGGRRWAGRIEPADVDRVAPRRVPNSR